MIGWIQGELVDIQEGLWTVMTHGVGYDLRIPNSAEYGAQRIGASVSLRCYTHVREDALDLYGFLSSEEKEFFLLLLSVNGIGPKVALGVLSHVGIAGIAQFASTVLSEDASVLTKISGIGKKTAERLILELRDPIAKRRAQGRWMAESAESGDAKNLKLSPKKSHSQREARVPADALQALLGLGYRVSDAEAMLEAVFRLSFESPEQAREASTQEWVKRALRKDLGGVSA